MTQKKEQFDFLAELLVLFLFLFVAVSVCISSDYTASCKNVIRFSALLVELVHNILIGLLGVHLSDGAFRCLLQRENLNAVMMSADKLRRIRADILLFVGILSHV